MSEEHLTSVSEVEYRPVEGFPGYRVGNDGSVWVSWRTCRSGRILTALWKPMKLSPGTKGYIRVNLTPPVGKYKTFSVHALVLEAFVGRCPEGMECRHLDGNKRNNAVGNLAWGTPEQNRDDIRLHHGSYQRGVDHSQAELSESDVLNIRRLYSDGELQRVIADTYGVSVGHVSMIVNRKTWRHI